MSTEPTGTEFPGGDFISENAVRAVIGRGRPTSRTTPPRAMKAVPPHFSAARADTSGPAGGGRRLRRWSVAELIARAVAPPPSTT
jgi:hypothetical protein